MFLIVLRINIYFAKNAQCVGKHRLIRIFIPNHDHDGGSETFRDMCFFLLILFLRTALPIYLIYFHITFVLSLLTIIWSTDIIIRIDQVSKGDDDCIICLFNDSICILNILNLKCHTCSYGYPIYTYFSLFTTRETILVYK